MLSGHTPGWRPTEGETIRTRVRANTRTVPCHASLPTGRAAITLDVGRTPEVIAEAIVDRLSCTISQD